MKTKALQMIEAHQMLQPGDRVCVALSGGADSVALLAFLRSIAPQYELQLFACHLNHLLRGDESQRDEAFVRALCQALDIPLTVEHQPIAELSKASGDSLELAGRQARYALFARLHEELCCKVATAHTLSDQIETVLHRLTRGTGVAGLQGIAPVRDWLIRPLLGCTRQDVEDYCRAQQLSFVQDSTNFTTVYTRNKLRLEVVPRLYEINPSLHTAIAQMTQSMADCYAYLQQQAQAFLDSHKTERGVPCAAFLELPSVLRREVLVLLAQEVGTVLSARHTALCQQLAETGGAVQLGAGAVFRAADGWMHIVHEMEDTSEPFAFLLGTVEDLLQAGETQLSLPDGRMAVLRAVDCEQMKNFSKQNERDLKNTLFCGKMNGNLVLRTRQEGDRLNMASRGVTKRLKKLFQEAGIPPQRRDEIPVLADADGVLWVEGFGADRRASLSEMPLQHTEILMIEIERICGYDKYDGSGY